MDREVIHLRDSPIPQYATLVYNGFWFAPEREALQALVTETLKNLSSALLLVAAASVAQAAPPATVPVANPGNSADATGYGAVAYAYQIGKFKVTNAEYCEFLNGSPRPIPTNSTTRAWPKAATAATGEASPRAACRAASPTPSLMGAASSRSAM